MLEWSWERSTSRGGGRGGVGGGARGKAPYLQVLPPHIDGREGQLHLLPAGVFVALVSDLYEDEEDPRRNATSHQHEYAWIGRDGGDTVRQQHTTH